MNNSAKMVRTYSQRLYVRLAKTILSSRFLKLCTECQWNLQYHATCKIIWSSQRDAWNNVYMDRWTVKTETEKFKETIKITQKTTDEVKSLAVCILPLWYITKFL